MGGVGRYFCVALPFILTIASIITTLIVGLTGVTSNELFLFRIDVSNFTINGTQLSDIANNPGSIFGQFGINNITDNIETLANEAGHKLANGFHDIAGRSTVDWHDPSLLEKPSTEIKATAGDSNGTLGDILSQIGGTKLTAADLGIANIYDVTLWGFCVTPQHGDRTCTKARFDWATQNVSANWIKDLGDATGLNVTLPKELDDGLKTYQTVTKWTEVVFIISVIALGLELLTGLFTACSRVVSCITWIVSGIATTAVAATAVLLTLTGSTVVGLVLSAAKRYNIKANLNITFLSILWLGVAFAVSAGLFWLFSICCCKPERRSHKKRSLAESEKIGTAGSYAPLGDKQSSAYNSYNFGAPQRGGARSDLAYEPYSHA